MNFLDPKERVLDLELTSYGRYLLSLGKFAPTYYAFYDDDIIYDATYAGITTEQQSQTEGRIQEETPRFAAQSIFSAREVSVFSSAPNIINDLIIGQDIENLKEIDKQKLNQQVRLQEQPEKVDLFQQPIGTSNSAYEYNPAWMATFLKSPLSSSTPYLQTSSSLGVFYKNIPQLNVTIRYEIERNSFKYNLALDPMMKNDIDSEEPFEDVYNLLSSAGENEVITTIKFDDGGSIIVKKDNLILQLEEANTFYHKDNFEIELYEIESINNEEILTPIKFYDNKEKLYNDKINGTLESGTAEELFTFLTDKDIPIEMICPLIKQTKVKQFFHAEMFDCSELQENFDFDNLYKQNNDTEDFCE